MIGILDLAKGVVQSPAGELLGTIISRHRTSTTQLALRVRGIDGLNYYATARRRKNGGASVIALRRTKPLNEG